jgi:translation initiation factor 2B subunit (eIF-2B alpha/beta/delta family)
MESTQEIAFGNLQGEVAVLRELVKALISQLPKGDATSRLLEDALNRARASQVHMSPDYISVQHAINQLQVHSLPR